MLVKNTCGLLALSKLDLVYLNKKLSYCRPQITDVEAVKELIDAYSADGITIPRSYNYLYQNLRDFIVCKAGDEIAGCCSIHLVWEDLAEVKSLAIKKEFQNRGIGARLVKKCVLDAKGFGAARIYALTKAPQFFEKLGFKRAAREDLPTKVWGECINCMRYYKCDETAVVLDLKPSAFSGHSLPIKLAAENT